MDFLLKSASSIFYIAEIIIGFGILVTVHEFGHFLLAKASGMRVDEFAIGFGKALIQFTRGETIYSLRLIPLGGFNRIYGMEIDEESADEEDLSEKERSRAFNLQPLYKRAAVIMAGSLMNIIFAVILIFILRMGWGVQMHQVASVNPGGPAYTAGVQEGDIITSIQGNRVGGMEIQKLVQQASKTQGGVKLTVIRQGEEKAFTLNPMGLRDLDARYSNLGFIYYTNGLIEEVDEKSTADSLGLLPGDNVRVVDGKLVERYVTVDGEYYLALDIRRFSNDMTLALPREEVRRYMINYTGLGFRYDSDWKVISVKKYSPLTLTSTQAQLEGVKVGDIVHKITRTLDNEEEVIETVEDYVFGVDDPFVQAAGDGPFEVTFLRDGDEITRQFNIGKDHRLLGISMQPRAHNVVYEIDEDGLAYKAGLRQGDEIIAVGSLPTADGNTVVQRLSYIYQSLDTDDLSRLLYDPQGLANVSREEWELGPIEEIIPPGLLGDAREESLIEGEYLEPSYTPYFMNIYSKVTLKVRRGNETLDVILDLTVDEDLGVIRSIGFFFAADPRKVGFFEALGSGFVETAYWIDNIFYTLNLLFTGGAELKELSGPVGIFTIGYIFAESGIQSLLTLLVIITINLAIINMLPFPALDGGRMVFLILEMFARRPIVSIKAENIIHIAGFFLLLLLIIYVTFFDIGRLITGFA